MSLHHLAFRVWERYTFAAQHADTHEVADAFVFWVKGYKIESLHLRRIDGQGPDYFVSEGEVGSEVNDWVRAYGPGFHHMAEELLDLVALTSRMAALARTGLEWKPIRVCKCGEGKLVQVFSHVFQGVIRELLVRDRHPSTFCKTNVPVLIEDGS